VYILDVDPWDGGVCLLNLNPAHTICDYYKYNCLDTRHQYNQHNMNTLRSTKNWMESKSKGSTAQAKKETNKKYVPPPQHTFQHTFAAVRC
jgi:hypothetical protein